MSVIMSTLMTYYETENLSTFFSQEYNRRENLSTGDFVGPFLFSRFMHHKFIIQYLQNKQNRCPFSSSCGWNANHLTFPLVQIHLPRRDFPGFSVC
jgi:hypothetical protein